MIGLAPSLAAPALLRGDAGLWLRERGVRSARIRVFHPAEPRGLISFKEPALRVGRDGIVLPVLSRDRRLEPHLGRHLAEGVLAALEASQRTEIGSAWRHPDLWPGLGSFGGPAPLLEVHDGGLYEILAATQTDFITATGDQTYTVPANWQATGNDIVCVGGGGTGGGSDVINTRAGGGGGGGACSQTFDVALTPGGSVACHVGTSVSSFGAGDTYANGASFGAASCAAKGGTQGSTVSGGSGGAASSGVGTVKTSGGDGANPGTVNNAPSGGGGGAGSPTGNGDRASSGRGGNSPDGGPGGSAATGPGDAGNSGSSGSNLGAYGTGGGGGGGWIQVSGSGGTNGGNGGSRGGGGGGAGLKAGTYNSGGSGGSGLIRFAHDVAARITMFLLV